MDLVGYSEARFREIDAELKLLVRRFRFDDIAAIPVASVTGENVARGSENMLWYRGPTLLDQLNRSKPAERDAARAFRMPVQTVLRDGQDFRGLAGTIASGQISVGDDIIDVVSGQSARVARISTMSGDLQTAGPRHAVAIVLDRDIDVSRGAVLARTAAAPVAARSLEARLVWLSDTAFDPKATYLLRTATDLVPISGLEIKGHLDLETLARTPATGLSANDIAFVRISLGRAAALDAFAAEPGTGGFVLVDPITGGTVAGGTVVSASAQSANGTAVRDTSVFHLTRELLLGGVNADLAVTSENTGEFRRRAEAVAELLRTAGVTVVMDEGI
jgi:bifunctional enzyme CysN/CysC